MEKKMTLLDPYYQNDLVTIYHGSCIDVLKQLPDEHVNCCVTSPPYWGLRDYGTSEWEGGDENCKHIDDDALNERLRQKKSMIACGERIDGSTRTRVHDEQIGKTVKYKDFCRKCGATRIDKQLGLEPTPEEYTQKMVDIFNEVHRVLKKDGTLWLNLGDSYASSPKGNKEPSGLQSVNYGIGKNVPMKKNIDWSVTGLKMKDLCGIPWRVAFALQKEGWYLRQDIIWSKPNPMPESVTDRCTKAHEYIFLLSKSKKYYYDADAIKEEATDKKSRPPKENHWEGQEKHDTKAGFLNGTPAYNTRNKRSVWTVSPKPFSEAHFAVYPPELITPCILAGCPPDGIVFDPFSGAFTTSLVASQLHRKSIGIELNEEYIKMAIDKRLEPYRTGLTPAEKEIGQGTLFD